MGTSNVFCLSLYRVSTIGWGRSACMEHTYIWPVTKVIWQVVDTIFKQSSKLESKKLLNQDIEFDPQSIHNNSIVISPPLLVK